MDVNHIEADLKLADLTVTVAVTVTRGFKTARIFPTLLCFPDQFQFCCYVFMVKSILVVVGTEVPMSGTETPVSRTCTLSEGPVSLK